ncbi:MAG TPA: PilZ domain-containing protein [Thermoanaerobaculia bacterium]|nr:PilZ domain-containing protein [Thermoanaerobaculia bacterium]HUM28621.1 PilZ domain-containing protein [Thermoanaerobaculia bacterium]HXK66771.1 PilZ domain-containing protein [Thermoanaerobaculia bacterium]
MAHVGLYCRADREAEIMISNLTRTGHKAVPMASREELFLLIPQHSIDLLIMDYHTPDGKNGFVMTQELRENPKTRGVSIILKIDRDDNLENEISSQGVNDFLLSPFHEEEFMAVIDKLSNIEKRRPFQSLLRLQTSEGSLMGKTLNISSTGLLVQVPRELSIGSRLEVHFFLPHSKEEIRCDAAIRRRAHERLTFNPCYGLEFVDLDKRDRERLEKFVKRW